MNTIAMVPRVDFSVERTIFGDREPADDTISSSYRSLRLSRAQTTVHQDQSLYQAVMSAAMAISAGTILAHAAIAEKYRTRLRWVYASVQVCLLAFVLLFWIDPANEVRLGATSPIGVILVAGIRFPLYALAMAISITAAIRNSGLSAWRVILVVLLVLLNIPWMYLSAI